MEALSAVTLAYAVGILALLWLVSLTVYRLTLHPLAKFPGPRLAAVTRYYEGYYDLIQNGQYTSKIEELHRKYGMLNWIFLR